jgi:hypothetical protein
MTDVVDANLHPDLYRLEGTTLDVLGPNIANPHKNTPQARWESVSQKISNDKSTVPIPIISAGYDYTVPLTHEQKNLLPVKKDATPMYRRSRGSTDPSFSPDSAGGSGDDDDDDNGGLGDISSAAMAGRRSQKLGEAWKNMLLVQDPNVKDIDDPLKRNSSSSSKDFQPSAVKRHDSFNERLLPLRKHHSIDLAPVAVRRSSDDSYIGSYDDKKETRSSSFRTKKSNSSSSSRKKDPMD